MFRSGRLLFGRISRQLYGKTPESYAISERPEKANVAGQATNTQKRQAMC
jgi:hypothetical protein